MSAGDLHEGWHVVPSKITPEMDEAWRKAFARQLSKRLNGRGRMSVGSRFMASCEEVAYVAMLKAAPATDRRLRACIAYCAGLSTEEMEQSIARGDVWDDEPAPVTT